MDNEIKQFIDTATQIPRNWSWSQLTTFLATKKLSKNMQSKFSVWVGSDLDDGDDDDASIKLSLTFQFNKIAYFNTNVFFKLERRSLLSILFPYISRIKLNWAEHSTGSRFIIAAKANKMRYYILFNWYAFFHVFYLIDSNK